MEHVPASPSSTHPGPAATRGASQARLARVQALSGVVFAAFLSLHLLNTVLALWSASAYNAFQRATHGVYQQPAIELALILTPLLVHIGASLLRMRARRGASPPAKLSVRLHRYAGYFLAVFVFGHAAATRLPALMYGAYPEFEGVAFTLQFLPLWFVPYYSALAIAGLVHLTLGLPVALRILGLRLPRAQAAFVYGGLAFGSVVLLFAVGGFWGLWFDVPDQSAHPFAQALVPITQ